MSVSTMEQLKRRELAVETADKIIKHPSYPFDMEFPRAMIVIIDLALEKWKGEKI